MILENKFFNKKKAVFVIKKGNMVIYLRRVFDGYSSTETRKFGNDFVFFLCEEYSVKYSVNKK